MIAERFVGTVARGGTAVVLLALVAAAFVMPRTPAVASAAAGSSERAAPIARHLVRDVAPAASVVTPDEPIDDVLVAPVLAIVFNEPEPVAAAEPEPEPPPVAVVRPAPVAPAVPVVTADTGAAELVMLRLMNASRADAGLVPLALDATVSNTARAHSAAESQVGYVYHDGPDGTARSRDATACATGWYGENTGKVWNNNVAALHIEFMAEPWEPINHRTNIMDPAFRRVGIGAVQGRDALYMTMVFCR